LNACSFSSGAREIAQNITSWFSRCTCVPLKPPAIAEHDGRAALVGLEAVVLLDRDPRELLAPARQLVAAARVLLLGLEQLEAGGAPLLAGSGLVRAHRGGSFQTVGILLQAN
jgi:hypothetical protein